MEMISETHQQEGMDEETFERHVEKIENFNFDRSTRKVQKGKEIFSKSPQGNLIVKKLNEVQRKLKDKESQKQQIQVIF